MFLKKKLYIDMSSTCGSLFSPNKKIIALINCSLHKSHNHEIKSLNSEIKSQIYEIKSTVWNGVMTSSVFCMTICDNYEFKIKAP